MKFFGLLLAPPASVSAQGIFEGQADIGRPMTLTAQVCFESQRKVAHRKTASMIGPGQDIAVGTAVFSEVQWSR